MKFVSFVLAELVLSCLILSGAGAYPTSNAIMPTADILESGSVRTEYENDGASSIGGSDSLNCYMMQIGITPALELGLDRYEADGDSEDCFNLKYLIVPEDGLKPAIAVGAMDISNDSPTSYYGVGTKSYGKTRLHIGYMHADYSKGLMLGLDYELLEGTYFLADRMAGDENYTTLGLYHEFNDKWAASYIYGFANDAAYEDLSGINVSYTIPFSF